jgi:hypothetical protein
MLAKFLARLEELDNEGIIGGLAMIGLKDLVDSST